MDIIDPLFRMLAQKAHRHNLSTVALLLLESHRPLGWASGQLLLALSPLTAGLFDYDLERLARLVEDPAGAEQLARELNYARQQGHAPYENGRR